MILLAVLGGMGVLAWLAMLALVVGMDGNWLSELRRRHNLGKHVLRHLDEPKEPQKGSGSD